MLRESAKSHKSEVNLRAVMDPSIDSGIEHGHALLAFADAVTGTDSAALATAHERLHDEMGDAALVQAAAIIANFSMNDITANATGIPLESMIVTASTDFREPLGLDAFPSARNSLSPEVT